MRSRSVKTLKSSLVTMLSNLKPDLYKTIIFAVAAICATVLVAMGKVSPDVLKGFLFWLLPSPLAEDKKAQDG